MFNQEIVTSDAFLDMPASSQLLYFHLNLQADDDGFVDKTRQIMKIIGSADDDLKVLIAKRYVLVFESGVIVVKHWKLHNYIRSDRYSETKYLEEKSQLSEKGDGAYTIHGSSEGGKRRLVCQAVHQASTNGVPSGCIGKESLVKSKEREKEVKTSTLTPSEKVQEFMQDPLPFFEEFLPSPIDKSVAVTEVQKFISYWTEPNKSGTKQRWQLEKTFELKRRLATWFGNIKNFSKVVNDGVPLPKVWTPPR